MYDTVHFIYMFSKSFTLCFIVYLYVERFTVIFIVIIQKYLQIGGDAKIIKLNCLVEITPLGRFSS